MKNNILLWMIALLCASTIHAQDDYYYYKGEKYTLTRDNSKMVCISPRHGGTMPQSAPGQLPFTTIQDDDFVIEVYDSQSSQAASSGLSLTMDENVSRQYCYTGAGDKQMVPTGYLYVKLNREEDYPVLQETAERLGCKIVRQNKFMPLWYTLRIIPGGGRNSVSLSNQIYETGLFASASPDLSHDTMNFSYDDYSKTRYQWNLHNTKHEGYDIQASAAWNYATGKDIVIAIIDSGVDMDHEDLKDNIYELSYDAETDSYPSKLYNRHGTHCAGIAAAIRNNKKGIAGVAPDAKIMPISILLERNTVIEENYANGINWAWLNGADVISCSWGLSFQSSIIADAIDYALEYGRDGLGCVFVNAAGNTGNALLFPANYCEDIIAVANMTESGIMSSDSSYGENIFITAPGTNILSTVYEALRGISDYSVDHTHSKVTNMYDTMNGTSMACPHVAGVAALILERNPELTARDVREILGTTTKKIGTTTFDEWKEYGSWNEHYGYGLVNAYEAVKNTPR